MDRNHRHDTATIAEVRPPSAVITMANSQQGL